MVLWCFCLVGDGGVSMNFELQISLVYQYRSSRCGIKKLHGPDHAMDEQPRRLLCAAEE